MQALPPINCNGCRKCCEGDTITLMAGDDPAQYKTKLVDGARVLARKKDGNCVYLGSRGCTIYFRQPVMCRVFDCRRYSMAAVDTGDQQRRRVIAEGRRRLNSAPP